MVTCKDLLNLNIFKYIKLIAGKNGIYKTVTWTYICETIEFSKWVNGGELIFITGMGMDLDERSMKKFLLECGEKDISGVVILTNSEYIKEIPTSCIELANNLNLPLFNMAWDIKLIDATKEISNYIIERSFIENKEKELLKELLFSYSLDKERIYKLCKSCKFKTKDLYFAAVFNIEDIDKNHIEYIIDYVKVKLRNINIKFLLDIFENNIICIINNILDKEFKIKQVLNEINNNLNECNASILSIGRSYSNIFDIKISYEECINILDYYRYQEYDDQIIDYDKIGFYKLLFYIKDIDQLKLYRNEAIGKLLEYDKDKNSNMLKTLKVYLYNDCNLIKTSNKLFIHRNTLIYRINKIKNILDINLDSALSKNELINAIMIDDYIRYLENK
ncbi:PucR family transcriptional regulator [Paraclostridium bifermentans]|uniref:PucR family transcriptional regulator n=2 Tax=Paraclostridium bifermentans TaxID=1490 RepID=UPI00359C2FA4